jgi:hypothetical protein
MRQFALVGRNLLHTFSPAFFEQKFLKETISDAHYQAVSLSEIMKSQILFGKRIISRVLM